MALATRFVIVTFLAAVVSCPAAAQVPTSSVTGVVRDSASNPLADARVSARSRATGVEYGTRSDLWGRYWLRALPPGDYDLLASRMGSRSTVLQAVRLVIGRTIEVDFALTMALLELEPLLVNVEHPLVETTKSSVSYVLDRALIDHLPDESRSFVELAQLVPGASAGTAATGGPPPFGTQGSTIGALNRQSQGILVDGVDFTEAMFGDMSGSVPLLAIREFEVIQSQYSARFGKAASGVINVATRRGSNDLTVESFGLFRHKSLTARGAFESEKPDFRRSHWGAVVGGPLVRDRTHFFAAYERRDQSDFATVNTRGSFPALEGTFRTPFTDNLMLARIDHRVGDAHELTLRYSGEIGRQLIGVGGRNTLEYGRNNELDMHSLLLTDRWSTTGTVLNEARLHALISRRALGRNAAASPTRYYPNARIGAHQSEERTGSDRIEVRNDLSWIESGGAGVHALRVGAHVSLQHNETRALFFDNGLFNYQSDTASLPVSATVTVGGATVELDAHNLQLAFYVEDDWSVAPDLTLNLGLRYDIETNGSNQGYVSPFAGQLPFIRTRPRPVDKNNVSPRLGVAWDARGDGTTVVRGGLGVFYDALVAGPLLAFERSNPRTVRVSDPGTTDIAVLGVDPNVVPPVVFAVGDIETPFTRQVSVGVQQRLAGDWIVRVDGMFIQGRNLLMRRDVNPMVAPGVHRYSDFAAIFRLDGVGRAAGKMLLVDLRRTFAAGWVTLGYTLANRENTSDSWSSVTPQTDPDVLDLDREWGRSAWDERHRLVATGGLEIPYGLAFTGKLIYSSSRPFSAITGNNDNGDFSGINDRPLDEGRNTRAGPDFLRADIGLTWSWPTRAGRVALVANTYNVLNTTNADPTSIQRSLMEASFGQPSAALPGRQLEIGLRVGFGGGS